MQPKKSSVHFTSDFRAGDEIMFQHAGLLSGRVERVTFTGQRVRYEVTATLTFDVPESAIVGRESEILGGVEQKGECKARGRR